MTIQIVRDLLFWCSVIDLGLLVIWFAAFTLAHDWMYRLHGLWFTVSRERFDSLHYLLMGGFKLAVLLLNVVPYLVLRFLVS